MHECSENLDLMALTNDFYPLTKKECKKHFKQEVLPEIGCDKSDGHWDIDIESLIEHQRE
jgi:hypothetical protein